MGIGPRVDATTTTTTTSPGTTVRACVSRLSFVSGAAVSHVRDATARFAAVQPRTLFARVCGAISIEHQIVDFRSFYEWQVRVSHGATVGNSLSLRLNNSLVVFPLLVAHDTREVRFEVATPASPLPAAA